VKVPWVQGIAAKGVLFAVMKRENQASEACVKRIALPGADVALVRRSAFDEAFVSAALRPGDSVE
jgi:hypothetical protein